MHLWYFLYRNSFTFSNITPPHHWLFSYISTPQGFFVFVLCLYWYCTSLPTCRFLRLWNVNHLSSVKTAAWLACFIFQRGFVRRRQFHSDSRFQSPWISWISCVVDSHADNTSFALYWCFWISVDYQRERDHALVSIQQPGNTRHTLLVAN